MGKAGPFGRFVNGTKIPAFAKLVKLHSLLDTMRRESQAAFAPLSDHRLCAELLNFFDSIVPGSGDMPFAYDDSGAPRRRRLLPVSIRGVTVDSRTGSNEEMTGLAWSRGKGIWAFAEAHSSSNLPVSALSVASLGPHDARPAKSRRPFTVHVAASIAESLSANGSSVKDVCEQLALLDGEMQMSSIEGAIHGESVGYCSDTPRVGEVNSKKRTIPTSPPQLVSSQELPSGKHTHIHRKSSATTPRAGAIGCGAPSTSQEHISIEFTVGLLLLTVLSILR